MTWRDDGLAEKLRPRMPVAPQMEPLRLKVRSTAMNNLTPNAGQAAHHLETGNWRQVTGGDANEI